VSRDSCEAATAIWFELVLAFAPKNPQNAENSNCPSHGCKSRQNMEERLKAMYDAAADIRKEIG
jgi:hypothetical protein